VGGSQSKGQPGQKHQTPSEKQQWQKGLGHSSSGRALCNKHRDLCSNSSITKKKIKKKEGRELQEVTGGKINQCTNSTYQLTF
jgi:hypothetical protein